jgi:hypothetical protein
MLPALEKEETIFRSQGENPFEIVEIARGSPLWPAANDAGMDLYDVTSIFVSFHKRVSEGPVWIWDYADLSASVEKPQFRMRRWTQGGKTELVLLVEFDSSKWTRRSGRVTSVPDLLGSEIIISLGFNYGETERKVSLRPRFLVLTVAEGVGFVFQSDQLRTLTMESGHPVISAIFPKTEVELEELSRIY